MVHIRTSLTCMQLFSLQGICSAVRYFTVYVVVLYCELQCGFILYRAYTIQSEVQAEVNQKLRVLCLTKHPCICEGVLAFFILQWNSNCMVCYLKKESKWSFKHNSPSPDKFALFILCWRMLSVDQSWPPVKRWSPSFSDHTGDRVLVSLALVRWWSLVTPSSDHNGR